jgi:predicted O-methyltransferase YrrM
MLNTKSIWYLIIEAEEETIERAKKMLRMPPVLKTRKEINETLEHDELLDGHDKDNANMVFTDISQNVHNRVSSTLYRHTDRQTYTRTHTHANTHVYTYCLLTRLCSNDRIEG